MKLGKRLHRWVGRDGSDLRAYYQPGRQSYVVIRRPAPTDIVRIPRAEQVAAEGHGGSSFMDAQTRVLHRAGGIR